jgi:Zn-dependent protease
VLGGFAKFFAFFVSFAAYSVWFHSWQFGLGFVLLILVHELGHVAEAKRQGLPVTLPTFIPFIGAYVTVHHSNTAPWRSALVSLAGPFAGGLAAAGVWAYGSAQNTAWLVVLANLGFLLNAFNMLPIGFLDGGAVWRAVTDTWQRPRIRFENDVPVEALPPDRAHAALVATLYFLLAAALVGGMLATRHSGML